MTNRSTITTSAPHWLRAGQMIEIGQLRLRVVCVTNSTEFQARPPRWYDRLMLLYWRWLA